MEKYYLRRREREAEGRSNPRRERRSQTNSVPLIEFSDLCTSESESESESESGSGSA
jgi:hypothetical protein